MSLYFKILLFSFIIPFIFSFNSSIRFNRYFPPLFIALLVSAIPFIVWDIYFTYLGVWGFNTKHHSGILLSDLPLEEMASTYILGLMTALKIQATRKKHANTLSHIQGYFSKHLQANEREELCEQINAYREGLVPLVAPLTLIKHYLLQNPIFYLRFITLGNL